MALRATTGHENEVDVRVPCTGAEEIVSALAPSSVGRESLTPSQPPGLIFRERAFLGCGPELRDVAPGAPRRRVCAG